MDALPDSADVGHHAQVLAAGAAEDPVALVDRAACAAPPGGGSVPLDRRQAAKDAAALQSLEDVCNLPDDDRYLAMVLARVMQAREEDFGHVLRTEGALPDAQAVVGHLGDPGFLRLALAYEVGAANLVARNRAWLPKPPSTRKRKGARLRESQLAKLPPGRHSDNDGFGLHAHVRKKGRVRWIARITCGFLAPREKPRKRGGKTVVVKECPRVDFALGRWPAMSLQEARAKAAAYYGLVQQGADPRVEQARVTLTMREAWSKALPDRVVASRWKGGLDGLTATKMAGTFRKHVAPRLGERPVAQVTVKEISKLLKELVSAGFADVPAAAVKALNVVFDWAVDEGLREGNPCKAAVRAAGDIEGFDGGVSWVPVGLAYDAYRLICQHGGPNPGPVALSRRLAMRAQVLFLKRPAETLGLRWEDIDWDAGLIRIPKERMKGRLPKRRKSRRSAQPGDTAELSGRAAKDPRELDNFHVELMTAELRQVLQDMKAISSGTGLVFQVEENGAVIPVTKNHLQEIMRDVVSKLGTVGTPHGWRKTSGTWAGGYAEQEGCDYGLITALAKKIRGHEVGDAIELKYNRQLSLERRLELQERWVRYLHTKPGEEPDSSAVALNSVPPGAH